MRALTVRKSARLRVVEAVAQRCRLSKARAVAVDAPL
jgi:predicted nuclease with RNAse H fold